MWVETSSAPRERAGAAYGDVLRNPPFWRVLAVTVLVNPCLYFQVNWLPTYFVQQPGLAAGRELGLILTLIYIGLDRGYLTCGVAVRLLMGRGLTVSVVRRVVFSAATVLLALSCSVPFAPDVTAATVILVVVNIGVRSWISMYLAMAQEVSAKHVSTAVGLLGGWGSLAGALAMWAVGRVTRLTASFAIPMAAVSAAPVLAAAAGFAVSRERAGSVS